MRTRATIVWHTNESCSGGHLVITDMEDLNNDFLAENVLESEFEPEIGEFLDTDTISMVNVIQDGEVTKVPVSELLRAYDKDRFAVLGWCPGDVLAHRPGWTEQQARAWLQQNEGKFQSILSERGNEVLGAMIPKEPLPRIVCIWAANSNGYAIEVRQGDQKLSSWTCPVAKVDDKPIEHHEAIREYAKKEAEKVAKSYHAEEIIEHQAFIHQP